MPKLAHFDRQTGNVIGWLDTDRMKHPDVPADCVELSDEQWAGRMASLGAWQVLDGKLLPRVLEPVKPPPVITFKALLDRMTETERDALASAARTDNAIFLWITTASTSAVNLASADTRAEIDMLVHANILTQDRAKALLTP